MISPSTPFVSTDALRWLESEPEALAAARASIATDGVAAPDVVLGDPAAILTFAKELAIEAIRRDAPPSVVATFLAPLERMQAGVANLDRYQYTRQELKKMTGARDHTELLPALKAAYEGAPDAFNKAKLAEMMAIAAQKSGVGEADSIFSDIVEFLTDVVESACFQCCTVGCLVCGEGCVVCCVTGCLIC